MKTLTLEFWITVAIVRAFFWIGGIDIFARGKGPVVALFFSFILGALLTAIYRKIKSEVEKDEKKRIS